MREGDGRRKVTWPLRPPTPPISILLRPHYPAACANHLLGGARSGVIPSSAGNTPHAPQAAASEPDRETNGRDRAQVALRFSSFSGAHQTMLWWSCTHKMDRIARETVACKKEKMAEDSNPCGHNGSTNAQCAKPICAPDPTMTYTVLETQASSRCGDRCSAGVPERRAAPALSPAATRNRS